MANKSHLQIIDIKSETEDIQDGWKNFVLTDYPTGPTLVWTLAVVALLGALVLSRRRSGAAS